ncbi:MAG: hypothetical protein OHK0022_21600 [Roseiflexaceae bacterium]
MRLRELVTVWFLVRQGYRDSWQAKTNKTQVLEQFAAGSEWIGCNVRNWLIVVDAFNGVTQKANAAVQAFLNVRHHQAQPVPGVRHRERWVLSENRLDAWPNEHVWAPKLLGRCGALSSVSCSRG